MRNSLPTTLLTLTLILAPSLAQAEPFEVTSTSTSTTAVKMAEAHINLSPFTAIHSDVVASIRFYQSDRYRIEAKGPERVITAVDVRVEDGVLHINTKKNIKMKRGEKLSLTIYGTALDKIRLDGVGNLTCSEPIETNRMEIINTGVGNIRIDNLVCDELIVKNEGVGNIRISGNAQTSTYMSEGVGNIYAYGLQSQSTTVNLNGVGSVQCHATQQCELTNNGVGHVYYKGNPAVQRIHKNGIGAISRR